MRTLNKTKASSIAQGIWKVENIVGDSFVTIVLDRPLLPLNPNDQKIRPKQNHPKIKAPTSTSILRWPQNTQKISSQENQQTV